MFSSNSGSSRKRTLDCATAGPSSAGGGSTSHSSSLRFLENHHHHRRHGSSSKRGKAASCSSTASPGGTGCAGRPFGEADLGHFETIDRVPTLLDLAAKSVAENLCFQTVEERYALIPEAVQKRILFWSFPRSEKHIRMYSSPSACPSNALGGGGGIGSTAVASIFATPTGGTEASGAFGAIFGGGGGLDSNSTAAATSGLNSLNLCTSFGGTSCEPSSFTEGLRLIDNGCVEDVLQIGFHLTGVVRSLSMIDGERKPFSVSVSFDRCKITSVKCTCDSKDIHWCQHVVALAVFRIRCPGHVKLRLPISETLYQMDRDQLQKFVQYLISEHHTEVLPTAQSLADEILQSNSKINKISGAPDPTAGPSVETEHQWFIDESQVSSLVRSYLSQTASMDQLHSLFMKVRDMLYCRDENGQRLLSLITEQFLTLPWYGTMRASYHPSSFYEKCQQLWDQLAGLWVSVVLNPYMEGSRRVHWQHTIKRWAALPNCPPEDALAVFGNPFGRHAANAIASASSSAAKPSRSVFHRALDACAIAWDDENLQRILRASPRLSAQPLQPKQFQCNSDFAIASTSGASTSSACSSSASAVPYDLEGHPIWQEHLPTACARIECLRAHGYADEALSLAIATVYSLKHVQRSSLAASSEGYSKSGNGKSDENSLEDAHHGGKHQSRAGGVTSPSRKSSSKSHVPHHHDNHGPQPHSFAFEYAFLNAIPSPYAPYLTAMSLSPSPSLASLGEDSGNGPSTPIGYATNFANSLCSFYAAAQSGLNLLSSSSSAGGASSSGGKKNGSSGGRPGGTQAAKLPEGWIGHPLDPVNSLFDTLMSAAESNSSYKKMSRSSRSSAPSRSKSSSANAELCRTLAVEAAMIALSQQRSIPACMFSKQKALKQEEVLIRKLEVLSHHPRVLLVIREQVESLLAGAGDSALGESAHPESMPMHTFARFLFQVLLPQETSLAYKVGLRAMSRSVLHEDGDDNALLGGHPSIWTIPFSHMETQQQMLAFTMFIAAKEDFFRQRIILESIQANMRSSCLVYKLAHDVYRDATAETDGSLARQNLLNMAFELGLQVLRMTVGSPNWARREMIKWLVNCASTLNFDAIMSVLTNWGQLFTPVEASGIVAQMIVNEMLPMHVKLDSEQKEKLARAVHTVALQCALKTPPTCALNALSLCESDPAAFENAYEIVVQASQSGCMPPQEIFNIAKHMESRGRLHRAFRLALLGLSATHIGYSEDASPLVTFTHWACALAHKLGKTELSQVLALIVKNVQCAVVLSDLLVQCFLRPYGYASCAPFASSGSSGGGKHRRHHHHHGSHHHSHSRHHYSSSYPGSTTTQTSQQLAAQQNHPFAFDKQPLKLLVDAAIAAYVNTTQCRLAHISPRHYSEFIDFLMKAKDTFGLAEDGHFRFGQMIENMKNIYKGKKKLMALVIERFG